MKMTSISVHHLKELLGLWQRQVCKIEISPKAGYNLMLDNNFLAITHCVHLIGNSLLPN